MTERLKDEIRRVFERLHATKFEVTYLFPVKALIKNDPEGPNVDFTGDFRRILADDETLRRQIPIGSGALRRQIHAVIRIVVFRIHDFGKTEVGNLDVATDTSVGK